jgi:hypothetical protein
MKITFYNLAAALLLAAGPAPAADLVREARIATQIEDAVLDGEVVWLQAGTVRFLAIHTPAEADQTRGAVILLHGADAHPDWPEVVFPLRTGLPGHGWETLSIQLPVSAPDAPPGSWQANLPLAAERIAAASAWLQQEKNNLNQVLLGHSLGARMGAEYLGGLHGEPDPAIRAFVAIGLTANPADTGRGVLLALKQLRVPVLDVYGERDFGGVIHGAQARERAVLDGKTEEYRPRFTQVVIPSADHFFRGTEGWLLGRVRAWLAKTAEGFEADGEQLGAIAPR